MNLNNKSSGLRAYFLVLFSFLIGLSACSLNASSTERISSSQLNGSPSVLAESGASISGLGEWAMEGYNPQRSRATSDDITPPLNISQEVIIGGDTQFGSPVGVARNLLLVEGSRKLHAFALDSGQEQWNIDLPGFFISPAVADDIIFVRAESGNDGFILALSTEAGLKLWQYKFPQVGSNYNNVGGHVTSPVVSQGLVFVGAAQTFRALQAETGKEIWEFKAQEPIASSATIGDDTVYFTDFTHLYALDLKTGEERWNFTYDDVSLLFAPVIIDHQIIITSRNNVYALDRSNGDLLWSKNLRVEGVIPSAASGDRIFIKSVNQLFALDRQSGETIWSYQVTDFISLPAITEAQVFIITRAGGNGQLRALRLSDGQEIWQSEDIRIANAAPIVAGGLVYVRTIDGSVLAYE